MTIISSSIFKEAKGSLGNVVLYTVKGQVRMRAKAVKYTDRKSEGQLQQRKKLKHALELYQFLDRAFVFAWKEQSKQMVMNACNLFIRENIRHLGAEGEVTAPELLKITAGGLPLPPKITARQEEDHCITVEWEPQSIHHFGADDLLLIGIYGYSKGFRRKTISCQRQVLASRRDKGCRFALPRKEGVQHVYACFKSRYTEEYSDSVYLGSWEG